MIMPVMDGLTAFSEIRRIDAGQKVIFVSGYAQQEDLQFIRDHANGFIRKPFNIQDFLRQVDGVLHYS
jgi:CheY-like chemotaxis protein